MINKAKVVIGSGYGDEGKGLFTQYFSSLSEKSIVIRFNGGAQAGHTIISSKGDRHVFGHFTANSFLKNSKGYLSKHFIINPIMYLKELEQIKLLGFNPTTACHSDCYITTPYDMIINQWLEISRGNSSRHGSCGLGIGETVHRNEIAKKTFNVKDLMNGINLREKLNELRDFFKLRVNELGLSHFFKDNEIVLSDNIIENFISDLFDMKNNLILGVNLLTDPYFSNHDIVFEGAQGLLLDQTMGEFPHVTRSNTGLKNVIDICIENNIKNLDVLYATRCYKTRHGAGSLKHELKEKPYENIIDMTNIHNEFQGSLRFAYLDIDELINTIHIDINSVLPLVNNNNIKINKMLGISCLDQTDEIKYFYKENLNTIKSSEFYSVFNNEFTIFESWSAEGDKIFMKQKAS
jgi:adenylosuccinate synthase